jgi:hypothetical protein
MVEVGKGGYEAGQYNVWRHGGLVVPVHKVEGSLAMSCVNRGIICMDTGLDGGVPIGCTGGVGAICLLTSRPRGLIEDYRLVRPWIGFKTVTVSPKIQMTI